MSEATHAGYKEDGVEKYQILATLDSKTCGVCGDLDGKVYKVGEEVVGVNMPPFHPLCRCTDGPCYNDTDLTDMSRVARAPETGKTYDVPGDMTYNEWKKEYLPQKEKMPKKAEDLIRNHKEASDTQREREAFSSAVAAVPEKVKKKLEEGTVIDVGQIGASQYDYVNDILYIAKGAEKEDVIHEIGHLVENKMLDSKRWNHFENILRIPYV